MSSDTLLVIHSYRGAAPALQRHWPYWTALGLDMAIVDPVGDKPYPLPVSNPGSIVGRWEFGQNWHPFKPVKKQRYYLKASLCEKLIQTFGVLRHLPQYRTICIIEYDCLILRPLPKHFGGLLSYKAVGPQPEHGLKAPFGLHCPWWADRETADAIWRVGQSMIAEGDVENGSPDIFLGLLVEKYGIPFSDMGSEYCFSRNTIDVPADVIVAKQKIKDGITFLHGVKHEWQLRRLFAE